MIPRLRAEEMLTAMSVARHPHSEAKDQRRDVRKLEAVAGIAEPPKKATRAAMRAIGIRTN